MYYALRSLKKDRKFNRLSGVSMMDENSSMPAYLDCH
jgi:hypothetical protein